MTSSQTGRPARPSVRRSHEKIPFLYGCQPVSRRPPDRIGLLSPTPRYTTGACSVPESSVPMSVFVRRADRTFLQAFGRFVHCGGASFV